MTPPWLARVGLGVGAALLKKRLKGKGKEAAGEIRKKMLAKLAKERDKYMPEHLKEKAKKIEFYHPVRNAKDAKKFIKDVLGDKGAKKPKPSKKKTKDKEKKKKDKKTDKKKYKITSKSFKKKPMTEKQARHATRPLKKYETEFKIEGKKYKLTDSDGSEAARRKGINRLDRFDAPKQRVGPQRLPKKKGKTKIVKQKFSRSHWSEEYK
jgi:hypothetical protein